MINKEELLKIDLRELSSLIIEDEFRGYFLDDIGKEHYKLIAYFSKKYQDSLLIDIGSYKGCSALAMSYNKNNNVLSFDIRQGLKRLKEYPTNIEFIIANVMDPIYKEYVLSSPFMVLDTDHDGPFENAFYEYLKSIQYKGLLLIDDIKYNLPMAEFWNRIDEEKYDVSEYGHHSGTGLVIFK